MKKIHGLRLWICALTAWAVLSGSPCQVQAAPFLPHISYDSVSIEDTSVIMKVSCSSTLLVRSGPSKAYDRIGSVNNGDPVQVTGICSNGWYRISFDDKEGYVYGDYLVASGSTDSDTASETQTDENASSDNGENPLGQWLSTLEARSLLPLLIPLMVILILAVSAILLFRSIRRDTAYEEDEEDPVKEEEVNAEVKEEELSQRVMRKTTPLPKIHTSQADPHMLDSEIRNFVVDDIGQYLDEDDESDDPQLSALEEELEATKQHLLELQKQIEHLKNRH